MSMARDGSAPPCLPPGVALLESLVTLENPLDLCYGGRSPHVPSGPLKVLECVKENKRTEGKKRNQRNTRRMKSKKRGGAGRG